jgi:hypothetical protein
MTMLPLMKDAFQGYVTCCLQPKVPHTVVLVLHVLAAGLVGVMMLMTLLQSLLTHSPWAA